MSHRIRRAFRAVAAAALATVFAFEAGPAAAAGGMTVLTVAGDSVTPNRPEVLEKSPGFFSFAGVTFEFGYAFDRDDLEDLGMVAIDTTMPGLEVQVIFSGPLLADVLRAAGATGATVTAQGLDGYAAEITVEEIETLKPILAIEADGEPMGIGGFGPAMVIFPPVEDADKREALAAKQVWGVYFIGVR